MAAITLLGIIAVSFCAGAIVMAFICSGSHQDLIAENDRLREQLAPTYEYTSVSLRPDPPAPVVGLSVADVITALGDVAPGHANRPVERPHGRIV